MGDAGKEWEGMMRYAVTAVQGSAVAQLNLAWLLQHKQTYIGDDRLQLCKRLLMQAGQNGFPEAWVDVANLAFWNDSLGALKLLRPAHILSLNPNSCLQRHPQLVSIMLAMSTYMLCINGND